MADDIDQALSREESQQRAIAAMHEQWAEEDAVIDLTGRPGTLLQRLAEARRQRAEAR